MLSISDWLAGPRVRARAVVSGNYRPKADSYAGFAALPRSLKASTEAGVVQICEAWLAERFFSASPDLSHLAKIQQHHHSDVH